MAAAWRVDKRALERAREELGIVGAVRVSRVRWLKDCAGAYTGRDPSGVHRIVLLGTLAADRASKVLWHELEHVRQCEHEHGGSYGRFWIRYRAQLEAVGINPQSHVARLDLRYRAIPYERAARLASYKHYRLALTRATASARNRDDMIGEGSSA